MGGNFFNRWQRKGLHMHVIGRAKGLPSGVSSGVGMSSVWGHLNWRHVKRHFSGRCFAWAQDARGVGSGHDPEAGWPSQYVPFVASRSDHGKGKVKVWAGSGKQEANRGTVWCLGWMGRDAMGRDGTGARSRSSMHMLGPVRLCLCPLATDRVTRAP